MSATLIARLIEAGTPADLVGEVAMELARAQVAEEALESRRKHERERKARSRDVTGQDVTQRDSQDKGSLEVSPHTPLPKPSKTSPLSPPKFMEAWNGPAKQHGLPTIHSISGNRLKALRARVRDHGEQAVLDAMAAVFRSPHWLGKNDWLGNFDSMLRPDNFVRLLEGAYGPKADPTKRQLSPDEQRENLEKAIPFYERIGRKDDADECRRKLASIGQLTRDIVRQARVG